MSDEEPTFELSSEDVSRLMQPPVDLPDRQAQERPQPSASQAETVAQSLIAQLGDRYRFGRTATSEPFAIPRGGGAVITPLRGSRRSLRSQAASDYFSSTGKVAPSAALADALATVEGLALREDPTTVFLRSGQRDGKSYLDLGRGDECIVEFAEGAWRLIQEPPGVMFYRTNLTGEFDDPVGGGEFAPLWDVVNVDPADRPLIQAFLVAALMMPDFPVPVLAVFAEQGSGKSTATRALVDLVDPSPVPLRRAPRRAEEWVVAAAASRVVALDNLSQVPEWLSDALCRACTGEGDVKRALYSDGDVAITSFRRCIIANGIDIGAQRGDLSERMAQVRLRRIDPDRRRTEADLGRFWAENRPTVLGALFDLTARVLHLLPEVEVANPSRMADFCHVLRAVDVVLGSSGLPHYLSKGASQAEDSLSENTFIGCLRNQLTSPFEGTSAELLTLVNPPVSLIPAPTRRWPSNGREVTMLLKRNAPALRLVGWTVESDEGKNSSNTVRWSIVPPPGV